MSLPHEGNGSEDSLRVTSQRGFFMPSSLDAVIAYVVVNRGQLVSSFEDEPVRDDWADTPLRSYRPYEAFIQPDLALAEEPQAEYGMRE